MTLAAMVRARPKLSAAFCAFVVLAALLVVGPEIWGQGKTKDYPLWLATGRRFLEGAPLYPDDGGQLPFLYSPFAAMIFAPVAALGAIPLYLSLVLAAASAWFWAVRFSVRPFVPFGGDAPIALLAWPSLIALPVIFNNFDIGQPNLCLLAIVLWALARDADGKSISAGALVGAAAAFKLFPLALAPFWLARGRWRALATMIASFAILLVAAPSLVRGPQRTMEDLKVWLPAITAASETSLAQRSHNWGYKNQSLLAVTHRLTRTVDSRIDRARVRRINLVDVGFEGSNVVFLCIASVIGAGFLVLTFRAAPSDDPRLWAVLLGLTTVASALARNYYFVWLIPALSALVADVVGEDVRRARRSRWFLVAGTAFMALSLGGVPKIFQAYGNMLVATLIFCVGVSLTILDRKSTGAFRDPEIATAPVAAAPGGQA